MERADRKDGRVKREYKDKKESFVIKTNKAEKRKNIVLRNIPAKKSITSKDSSDEKVIIGEISEAVKKDISTVQKLKNTMKLRVSKEMNVGEMISSSQVDDFGKDQIKGEEEEEISSEKVFALRKITGALKPISNIKTLKKNTSQKKSRALKRRNKIQEEKGVCVFKNIPHGFYDKEIKKYCSQFGKVTGVYHPVSKNGNSKGYAFVEFAHKDVAQVVAETMNNYVMFYKRMRCELVPKEKEKPWVFKRSKTNEDMARERREAGLKQRMRHLSKEEVTAWEKRKQARINALHKKLASLGVDYQFQVSNNSDVSEKEKTAISSLNNKQQNKIKI